MLVGRDNIWTAQVCWEKSTKARFLGFFLRRDMSFLRQVLFDIGIGLTQSYMLLLVLFSDIYDISTLGLC